MSSNIKIAPNQYLGNSFNKLKSELFSTALSKPTQYFDMRQNASDKLKLAYVDIFYDLITNFLRDGIIGGDPMFVVNGEILAPKFPENRIQEKALSACSTINDILDEIIDLLAPLDYNNVMNKRLSQLGAAEHINDSSSTPI